MTRFPLPVCLFLSAIAAWSPTSAWAAMPAEVLLPAETVAMVSVPNVPDLDARIERTLVGQLLADPSMKPFADVIRDKLNERLGDLEGRLGITIDDLRGVAGGELAAAVLPKLESVPASFVLTVDTTGHAAARDALLEKIERRLAEESAQRVEQTVDGATLVVLTVPPKGKRTKPVTAAYFVRDEQLVVCDGQAVAELLLRRLGVVPKASLSGAEGYKYVMQTTGKQSGAGFESHLRWYIVPFGLEAAIRERVGKTAAADGPKDRATILREQGFDAIRAVGGIVSVAMDAQLDLLHHTAVYAPAAASSVAGQKYRLAMNMLSLPNRADLAVQAWAPRTLANFTTVNVDLLRAFDNIPTLFDAFAGYEGAFDTSMRRFETDPFGPQIKFREQIIQCLGTRVTSLADYVLPITPQSERFLIAIEVKPEKRTVLEAALGKYLENDGYRKVQVDGRSVWEFTPEDESLTGIDEELLPGVDDGGGEPGDERLLIRSAVHLNDSELLIASDIELLRLGFRQAEDQEALAEAFDFQAVAEVLAKYGPAERASHSFTRTDEAFRPTYELVRQGKMPESETFFGRLMNELLTDPEQVDQQILRKQRIDGKELPSFELARRYFGPAGRAIRSDENGWLVTGVLLRK